jgi:SAM domain (Sterile alpha motif)
MDVVVWLRSLGLGKYETAFRENEITEKVLPNLTAEDLKELGVAALRSAGTGAWCYLGP